MKHGQFGWYELMTTDAEAALAFYGKVVGWKGRAADNAQTPYTVLSIGDSGGVAGVMALTPEMTAGGARPGWLGYIVVDDVDAAVDKLKSLGGSVHMPPTDIPGMLRFALVADPQGAAFYVFKGFVEMTPEMPQPPTNAEQGGFGWRELMAGDWEKAFEFYSAMFGWTKGVAVDMGDMGTYQCFELDGVQIGGMMTKPASMPAPPHWGYYIRVDGADAAVERFKAGGGSILMGPMEVPGGEWAVNAVDPQGAFVNMVSFKR